MSIAAPSSNDAEGWFKQNQYSWTFGLGVAGADGKASVDPGELYQVQALPTTVFIDRRGNVVDTVLGGMEKADFEARVKKLL